MTELDQTDRRILRALQRDGRISNADLAQTIGLAATSMSDRVKRLTRLGFITGYKAQLDPARLGLDLLVLIEVSLDKTTPDIFDKFAAAVRRAPEVLECHMVSGGFDYLIKARLPDMATYRQFLGDVLLTLPGVRETRSYPVIEEVKSDGPLPV